MGILAQLVRYLSHLHIDMEHFFRSVELDPGILASPDERIPIEKYILIEDTAAKVSNDPCFGLHFGQFTEAGNWTILGYMMMNCRTIREAFEKFARYSDIIGNLIKGNIQIDTNTVTIRLILPENAPIVPSHCYEGYFSSLIRLARNLTETRFYPMEVGFAFQQPQNTEEYIKVFGSRVLFGQNQNYMTMDLNTCNTPVLLPNESLLQYFEGYARDFLSGMEEVKPVTLAVKKQILSSMDHEGLTIKFIAKELKMSVRSLQMHLRSEGSVFSQLLRETRAQLAKRYLRENYSVEDITYLLGFADPSAFRKAFKKWSGMTPKEYRNQKCAD